MRGRGRTALLVAVAVALPGCGADTGGNEPTPPLAPSTPDTPVDTRPAPAPRTSPPTRSLRRASVGWRFDLDAAIGDDASRIDVLVQAATAGAAPRRLVLAFDGTLVDAFATDLDGDAAPELLLWTRSSGSAAEGELQGWRFDAGGDATALRLPPLEDDAAIGWRGRDQFGVRGDAVVRSFPLYRDGDDNAHPSAGFVRVIRYGLGGDGLSVVETTMEPMDGTPQADALAR